MAPKPERTAEKDQEKQLRARVQKPRPISSKIRMYGQGLFIAIPTAVLLSIGTEREGRKRDREITQLATTIRVVAPIWMVLPARISPPATRWKG